MVALATLASGCGLGRTAFHNLDYDHALYTTNTKIERELREDAREVFRQLATEYATKCFTDEFRYGFIEGYADHLDNGGTPLPPAVPPTKYRFKPYLSPVGHAQIQDYFIGFKYGAEVAAASGRREYFTLPILVGGPPVLPPLNIRVLPAPPEGISTDRPNNPMPPPLPFDSSALSVPRAVVPNP